MPAREKKARKEEAAPAPDAEPRDFDARREWQIAPELMRLAALEKLKQEHARARRSARSAWGAREYGECQQGLDAMLQNCDCEVLHRWRARLHVREGRTREAVEDTRHALELNPRSAANLRAHGATLDAARELAGSGQAYLQAMRVGIDGSTRQLGVTRLLHSTQRERDGHAADGYYDRALPPHLKLLDGHTPAPVASVGRSRSNIFDPRLVLEGGVSRGAGSAGHEPGAPTLRVVQVTANSVAVAWEPPKDDGGDEIYHYAVEMALFSTRWRPQTQDFFDDWLPYKVAHQGRACHPVERPFCCIK